MKNLAPFLFKTLTTGTSNHKIQKLQMALAAWPSGSERRFYDGHDRKVDG